MKNAALYFPKADVKVLGDFGDFIAKIFYTAETGEKGMKFTTHTPPPLPLTSVPSPSPP